MSKTATKTNNAKSAAKPSAKARGPKAGSSQRNQNVTGVKEPKNAGPETISSAVQAKGGNGLVVTTNRNRSIVVLRVDRRVNELTKLGAPVAELDAYLKNQPKPEAKLARGVDGKMTEHSRKAVADNRKSNGAAKAEAKAATPAKGKNGKARTVKADKAKAPAKGTNRSYTLGTRKDESKPDTFRRYMLSTIMKHKDTDSAKAAHAKSGKYPTHKLDFNWSAQQGYIKFAD
jgi:hypothetical protein